MLLEEVVRAATRAEVLIASKTEKWTAERLESCLLSLIVLLG
jgi:hypothetical protein